MNFYAKRMSNITPIKKDIIEKILEYSNGKQIKALDVGCGSGDISRKLSENGIWCMAIDKDFLGVPQEETELYHPIYANIIELYSNKISMVRNDFDVILFSSVLHEIPNALELLKTIVEYNKKPVRVIISEPLADDGKLLTKQLKAALDDIYETKKARNKHKKLCLEYIGNGKIQSDIFANQSPYFAMLNSAFVEVYGKASRKREMQQMRYTFSTEDWLNVFFNNFKVKHALHHYVLDLGYKELFEEVGLEDIFNELKYTHTIAIYDIE